MFGGREVCVLGRCFWRDCWALVCGHLYQSPLPQGYPAICAPDWAGELFGALGAGCTRSAGGTCGIAVGGDVCRGVGTQVSGSWAGIGAGHCAAFLGRLGVG